MPRRPESVVSAAMQKVKSRNTTPELKLRKALWQEGLRYRLHAAELAGRPDVVFPSAKVAVFVDGDFWHGNQWRVRGLPSLEDQFKHVANGESYWIPKIRRTMKRDTAATRQLRSTGWQVIRLWESTIASDLDSCVDRVASSVIKRRPER